MLENLSVQEIVSHIISKQITTEDVIEHYLNRIKKFNGSLSAIVSLKDEEIISNDDMVIVMGAGDIREITPKIYNRIK